jgi:hypothetical protein
MKLKASWLNGFSNTLRHNGRNPEPIANSSYGRHKRYDILWVRYIGTGIAGARRASGG